MAGSPGRWRESELCRSGRAGRASLLRLLRACRPGGAHKGQGACRRPGEALPGRFAGQGRLVRCEYVQMEYPNKKHRSLASKRPQSSSIKQKIDHEPIESALLVTQASSCRCSWCHIILKWYKRHTCRGAGSFTAAGVRLAGSRRNILRQQRVARQRAAQPGAWVIAARTRGGRPRRRGPILVVWAVVRAVLVHAPA